MSKYFLGKLLSKVLPKQKTTGTEVIKNVGIAKNLTTKRNIQDQVTETVDSAFKKANAPPSIANQQKKAKLKKEEGKKLKDFSYKLDKIEDKIDKRNKASKKFFNKGGRVGLKGGSFPDLNKDGKTTFADVLIGRGVLPKNKKKMVAKKTKTPMQKAIKKDKKRII